MRRGIPEMGPLVRTMLFAAILALFPLAANSPSPAQSALQDAETAIGEVEADFRIMLDSVDATTQKLDTFLENIELADEAFLRLIDRYKDDPAKVRELKEALRVVRTVQTEVYDQVGELKLLSKSAGYVKSAFDIYDQVQEMRQRAAARRGGPLAGNLSMLADVMKDYGGNVPLIGDAIAIYGDVTSQLLGATDKLAGTISDNFKQGMIGVGTSQNIDDPRYLRLKEQFPTGSQITLAPEGPDYLFKNIDTADQKNYIWDEEADRWYIAEGPVTASKVFGRVLMSGMRPTPAQLAFLVENGAAAQKREADAQAVLAVMTRMRSGLHMTAESEAIGTYGFTLVSDQRTPELFLSRYIYDGDYRDLVRRYAALVWADALTGYGSAHLAHALERWALGAGFDLFQSLSAEQQEKLKERLAAIEVERKKKEQEKQQSAKTEPETPATPAPGEPPQPVTGAEPAAPQSEPEQATLPPPPPQPELPVTTRIVPWDKADPRSVCLSYHTRAAKTFDKASYRNLVAIGDPVLNEKDGTCIVRYAGEMMDVNGVWRPIDELELSFAVEEIRNYLSQLDGENAYERVCREWKTIEWCAGQERICTENSTVENCSQWAGAIDAPRCVKWTTLTRCSKYEWICTRPKARTWCDKWGPAEKSARKERVPSVPPAAKTDSGGAQKPDCEAILKKYPPEVRSLEAMQARLPCQGIGR